MPVFFRDRERGVRAELRSLSERGHAVRAAASSAVKGEKYC